MGPIPGAYVRVYCWICISVGPAFDMALDVWLLGCYELMYKICFNSTRILLFDS